MYNNAERTLQSHNFSHPKHPFIFTPPSSTLAAKGYNTAEAVILHRITDEEKRKRYLKQNLETTVNHLCEDSVVSFASRYQLNNKGEIITYPDGVTLHLDPEERGDLYRFGLTSAIAGAIDNPFKVVTFFSPPGPIVFDDNPLNKYRDVDPYKIGQLYLMYFDGEKVNNVAISVSKEGEAWIQRLIPEDYQRAMNKPDEVGKVKYFITHPALHNEDIDAFLKKEQAEKDIPIYVNKDGVEFFLHQTIHLIKQSLTDSLPRSAIVEKVMRQTDTRNITEAGIAHAYDQTMALYMMQNNMTSMRLGGSCGGKKISLDSLNGLSIENNLTTDFRLFTQGGIDALSKTKVEAHYDFDYKPGHTCRGCGKSGESTKLGPCDICRVCEKDFK